MTFVLSKPQEQWQEMVALNRTNSSSSRHGDGLFHQSVGPALYDSKLLLRRRKKQSLIRPWRVAIAVVLLSVVVVPYYFSRANSSNSINNKSTTQAAAADDGIAEPVAKPNDGDGSHPAPAETPPLKEGRFGSDHTEYYHQPAGIPRTPPRHLVLLHGAAFTKEDWKTLGILDLFAEHHPGLAVTALDLGVSADYHKLVRVLSELAEAGIVDSLPVAGLVTPSASGKSVTTYVRDADTTTATRLGSYLSTWIPVASYSVESCTNYELHAFGLDASISILAIHGDRDKRGKRVSEKLAEQAGAEAVELPGPHPVYKESPRAFVDAVANKVLA